MIIKISPDKEKAKSILKLAEEREQFLQKIKISGFATIFTENYYEIIKELATAVLLVDGLKAIGEYAHKDLIQELSKYELESWEIKIIDDLRDKRNKSQYEGKQVDESYLENNKEQLEKIIIKIKEILKNKL
jgi:hypothetical protein